MKIFVLNRGSSSIKCFLYEFKALPMESTPPLWEAHLEWKNNFESPSLKINNKKVLVEPFEKPLLYLMQFLCDGEMAVLRSLEEIDVIGHRIVHGGPYFTKSVLITREVKEKIKSLSELAPLHNISELEDVEVLEKLCKNTPQRAVFDTAFHHTLSQAASLYPGPYQWFKEGIKRYGFHGISFQYCLRQSAKILKQETHSLKMVICHLGSGASLAAIKNDISIDTTMGFTPLDGLMMDTRSGSVDPGILFHLLKKKSKEDLFKELYQESGLLGVSGISSDMRDIIEKSLEGNERATLAFEVYLHRLNSLIGSMIASLQGLDVLVFTAGIGENASLLRARVCKTFSFLGIKLDPLKNETYSKEDQEISLPDSTIKVLLIHTQEAFEIARECFK